MPAHRAFPGPEAGPSLLLEACVHRNGDLARYLLYASADARASATLPSPPALFRPGFDRLEGGNLHTQNRTEHSFAADPVRCPGESLSAALSHLGWNGTVVKDRQRSVKRPRPVKMRFGTSAASRARPCKTHSSSSLLFGAQIKRYFEPTISYA